MAKAESPKAIEAPKAEAPKVEKKALSAIVLIAQIQNNESITKLSKDYPALPLGSVPISESGLTFRIRRFDENEAKARVEVLLEPIAFGSKEEAQAQIKSLKANGWSKE